MRILIALLIMMSCCVVAEATLTQAERDVHIRKMLSVGIDTDIFNNIEPSTDLCRWMVLYARTGADEKEAMKWGAKQIYKKYKQVGTVNTHQFLHWLREDCSMESGEGLEQ